MLISARTDPVGTHTGRRTFIVNTLSLGITPNIVMKWTGVIHCAGIAPQLFAKIAGTFPQFSYICAETIPQHTMQALYDQFYQLLELTPIDLP